MLLQRRNLRRPNQLGHLRPGFTSAQPQLAPQPAKALLPIRLHRVATTLTLLTRLSANQFSTLPLLAQVYPAARNAPRDKNKASRSPHSPIVAENGKGVSPFSGNTPLPS